MIVTGIVAGLVGLTGAAAGRAAVMRSPSLDVAVPSRPPGASAARPAIKPLYGRLPLSFEENRGQADPRVRFLAHGEGYRAFVTATETVLALRQPAAGAPSTVLRMKLVGGNPAAPSVGADALPGKVHYLIGNDPARWHTDLRTYRKVVSSEVYPGIALVHRGNQRQLEYDFVVSPGADPTDIRVSFSGMREMHLDPGGDLVLTTTAGELRQHKPYVYQERAGVKHAVAGRYVLTSPGEIGFAVGAYDASLPLVLDPVLAYATYLGGTANDEARAIAVDAAGNAYVAGVTSSTTTFPKAGGIPSVLGGLEAFVSKLSPAGDSLIYSTFIGDEASESANAIAVDDDGDAYVTGFTRSPRFPTTPNGYQRIINTGNNSAFVARLNASGNGLVYSTFLYGNNGPSPGTVTQQEGLGIAVDSTGHAYVTGWTNAVNFPQLNGYQGSNGGQIDAFVTKLNTTASGPASLVYSTYLGGGGIDHGIGIAVDSTAHAYVTGRTDSGASAPFPTVNAFQGTLGGATDAFVAKVDTMVSGVSSLVYSTYLGGSGNENQFTPWPGAIAVDSSGNAYVTGGTNSWSSMPIPFPTTPSAYQPTSVGVGDTDAFLTKFNPAGTAILYSTYFGGTGNDVGRGVAVDSTEHAYVTGEAGQTAADDFPVRNAVQPTYGGGTIDAFVAKIDTGASADASLLYATFLGGSNAELAFGVALNPSGDAYLAGKTNSAGLATTGAFQGSPGNPPGGVSSDAFVARIAETPIVTLVSLSLNPASVTGSKTAKATVALSNPAPAGGVTVTLTSSDTSAATVPASLIIAEGQTSRTFSVMTRALSVSTTVEISASYNGVTRTKSLTVLAAALKSLALSPAIFPGGCGQSTGKVTLTGKAPSGGVVVSLTDTNPAAALPASVTVPGGAVSATFTITAPAVTSSQTGNVTATLAGATKSKAVTVRPVGAQLVNLAPNPVLGPNSVTGTVTLECSAAPGDIVVTLSSNNPAVARPAVSSITIPSGSTTGTFTVTTADVSAVSTAVIKATAGGITKSRTLTVNP